MFKTIVMATDGSPSVERLLVYTEHMAQRTDAQVIVVHVFQLPSVYEWTDSYASLNESFRSAAQEVVDDAVGALKQSGIQAEADVREGDAAVEIVEAARVHQADLIIMGTRAQIRDRVAETNFGKRQLRGSSIQLLPDTGHPLANWVGTG